MSRDKELIFSMPKRRDTFYDFWQKDSPDNSEKDTNWMSYQLPSSIESTLNTDAARTFIRSWDDDVADRPLTDHICEWANCTTASVDDAGDVWIEGSQAGHWLSDERLCALVLWLRQQDEVVAAYAARIAHQVLEGRDTSMSYADAGYATAIDAARVLVGDGYDANVRELAAAVVAIALESDGAQEPK